MTENYQESALYSAEGYFVDDDPDCQNLRLMFDTSAVLAGESHTKLALVFPKNLTVVDEGDYLKENRTEIAEVRGYPLTVNSLISIWNPNNFDTHEIIKVDLWLGSEIQSISKSTGFQKP